jgi:hypothetical protein
MSSEEKYRPIEQLCVSLTNSEPGPESPSWHYKDVLRQCDTHGIDHRTAMNQTPLMAGAAAGNSALVEALLERGADRESTDQYGCNALHIALREAFRDPQFARGPCAVLYELLAPAHVDVPAAARTRLVAAYFRRSRRCHRIHQPFEVGNILGLVRLHPGDALPSAHRACRRNGVGTLLGFDAHNHRALFRSEFCHEIRLSNSRQQS